MGRNVDAASKCWKQRPHGKQPRQHRGSNQMEPETTPSPKKPKKGFFGRGWDQSRNNRSSASGPESPSPDDSPTEQQNGKKKSSFLSKMMRRKAKDGSPQQQGKK